MMTQQIYRGKYADSKPTEAQLMLLKKLGIRKGIIEVLDRQTAFELIHKCITQYYESKFEKQRKPKWGVLKW